MVRKRTVPIIPVFAAADPLRRRDVDPDRRRILFDKRTGIGQHLAGVEAFVRNLTRVVPEAQGYARGVLNIHRENLYGNHLIGERRRARDMAWSPSASSRSSASEKPDGCVDGDHGEMSSARPMTTTMPIVSRENPGLGKFRSCQGFKTFDSGSLHLN